MIRSLGRALGLLACFAGGLLLAGLALGVCFPATDTDGLIEQKLAHLRSARDRYDTLFIGSSRTYRQIDPEIFDRVTAQHGRPTRSYNFGSNGLWAPEDSYICEQILRAPPTRFRWVLLEISNFAPSNIADPVQPRRVVVWHDWRRTLSVCQWLWPEVKPLKGAKWRAAAAKNWGNVMAVWPDVCGHLRCFALRQSGLGRGAEALQRQLSLGSALAAPNPVVTQWAGYWADTAAPDPALIAQFRTDYAARLQEPAVHRRLNPVAQRNLDRMLTLIRAAGAEPVVFTAPTTAGVTIDPDPKSRVTELDFNDPQKYPALYEEAHRTDRAHLNEPGAKIFSELIAEEWVRTVERMQP